MKSLNMSFAITILNLLVLSKIYILMSTVINWFWKKIPDIFNWIQVGEHAGHSISCLLDSWQNTLVAFETWSGAISFWNSCCFVSTKGRRWFLSVWMYRKDSKMLTNGYLFNCWKCQQVMFIYIEVIHNKWSFLIIFLALCVRYKTYTF